MIKQLQRIMHFELTVAEGGGSELCLAEYISIQLLVL